MLAHAYKMSPTHVCSHDDDSFSALGNPAEVLPYDCGIDMSKVTVLNPLFDYVPPEHITLIITHQYVYFYK